MSARASEIRSVDDIVSVEHIVGLPLAQLHDLAFTNADAPKVSSCRPSSIMNESPLHSRCNARALPHLPKVADRCAIPVRQATISSLKNGRGRRVVLDVLERTARVLGPERLPSSLALGSNASPGLLGTPAKA